MRAALARAHAAGAPRDHRGDGLALHRDAEGVFPAGRHRAGDRLRATRRPTSRSRRWCELQQKVTESCCADPAVASVGSSVGGSGWSGSVNQRPHVHQPEAAVGARRADQPAGDRPAAPAGRRTVPGISLWMSPAQDMRRRRRARGRRDYQFTLWSPTSTSCRSGCRARWRRSRTLPGFVDVSTDRERPACSSTCRSTGRRRRGSACSIQDVDERAQQRLRAAPGLDDLSQRNQYRVILEIDPQFQRDPTDAHAHLRAGQRRRAGAAVRRGEVRAHARAAGRSTTRASSRRRPSPTASGPICSSGRPPRWCARPSPSCTCRTSMRAEFAGDAKEFASRPASSRC